MDFKKIWAEIKESWAEFKAHPIAWTFCYIFARIFGYVWYWVAVPFRGYARSVVYNGALQHGYEIKRLNERFPYEKEGGWGLTDIHNVEEMNGRKIDGFIKKRKVSKLKFWLVVLFLWGWMDDDSNEDTTDKGHILTFLEGGERSNGFLAKVFGRWLKKIDWTGVVYGNTFDLGDTRAEYKFFNWAAAFIWTSRNMAMNFKYLWLRY